MLPFGITFTRPYAVPPPNELLRPLLGTPLNIRTRLPNNHSNKMPQAQPELKKYMEKRVYCQINGNRKVIGILRGYDVFMNIVLDEAFEEKDGGEKVPMGMCCIRGNSLIMIEALERIDTK
jgi:small nuclear ribonucleoprotein G